MEFREKGLNRLRGLFRFRNVCIEFHPVAGGKDDRFIHFGKAAEPEQALFKFGAGECEFLPHINIGNFVIQSCYKNLHRKTWRPFWSNLMPKKAMMMVKNPIMESRAARLPLQPAMRRACSTIA